MASIMRRLAAVTAAAGVSAALALSTAAPAQAATKDWELRALGAAQAQQAAGQGEGVTIAIIDTGVDDTHPALKGKVTQGPDFSDGRLKQGDYGWGIHGTAMASDALKVAPKAKILSIRAIFDKEDPDYEDPEKATEEWLKGKKQSDSNELPPVAQAIRYAAANGADVISMSLGSDEGMFNAPVEEEQEAVTYAVSKGIPVMAGACNDGRVAKSSFDRLESNGECWPAGYLGLIAVAATNPDGSRAEFSTVHTYNDIAVPGVEIYSARPKASGYGYKFGQGTSQATALSSGVVALMKAKNPEITPAEVRTILRGTASGNGKWNAQLGFGQVNAAKAVAAAASPPKTVKEAAAYEGKEHLAEPDGTPKELLAPIHGEDLVFFGIGCALVVIFVGGGLLLMRRGKPKAGPTPAPATTGTPPPYGPQTGPQTGPHAGPQAGRPPYGPPGGPGQGQNPGQPPWPR